MPVKIGLASLDCWVGRVGPKPLHCILVSRKEAMCPPEGKETQKMSHNSGSGGLAPSPGSHWAAGASCRNHEPDDLFGPSDPLCLPLWCARSCVSPWRNVDFVNLGVDANLIESALSLMNALATRHAAISVGTDLGPQRKGPKNNPRCCHKIPAWMLGPQARARAHLPEFRVGRAGAKHLWIDRARPLGFSGRPTRAETSPDRWGSCPWTFGLAGLGPNLSRSMGLVLQDFRVGRVEPRPL